MPSITKALSDSKQKEAAESSDKLELETLQPQQISHEDATQWLTDKWQIAQEWLQQTDTYYQLAIIAAIIGVSYLLGTVLRNRFETFKEPKQGVRQESLSWFIRRTGRLFSPLLVIVTLLILEKTAPYFSERTELIEAGRKIAFIWLLWVGLKAFVTNRFVRVIAIWILIPTALLQLAGLFTQTIDYLDSLGFVFGELRVTLYTVARAVFVISFLLWIAKLLNQNAESYIRNRENLNTSTKELLVKFVTITFYVIIAISILQLIGINLTALTIFGGAIGVGLGFGLQKIASNFISGIILLSERNITIGNLVQLDNGMLGFVRSMGARASVVETYDGQEVIVPNEDFIVSRVSNLTHSNNRGRVDFMVGVSYSSDIHKVKQVIMDAISDIDVVLKDPEPKVLLREFGNSSVDFIVMFWIDDVALGRWIPQDEAMCRVWDALHEHGIEIPFPQRDLHLKTGFEQLQSTESKPKPKRKATSSKTKKKAS